MSETLPFRQFRFKHDLQYRHRAQTALWLIALNLFFVRLLWRERARIALVHAWLRRRKAWHEQFSLAALGCMLLGAFDLAGSRADAIRSAVDLTFVVFGLAVYAASRRFFRAGTAT